MKCPVCKSDLIHNGRMEKYETLLEHVSPPEGDFEIPERPVWECVNKDCIGSQHCFWDESGEFYCSSECKVPGTISKYEAIDSIWEKIKHV